MAGYTLSVHYDAPQDRVFEVFMDLEHISQRINGIVRLEVLTKGPVGLNTKFLETRKMFGRESTELVEVVAFDLGKSSTASCQSCGAVLSWTFELSSAPTGGTDVAFSLDIKPVTIFAKLLTPLSGLMMISLKKAMVQDFEDLRPHIENAAA